MGKDGLVSQGQTLIMPHVQQRVWGLDSIYLTRSAKDIAWQLAKYTIT